MKNIVWLASYPKSGNTWFRVLLSNILSPDREAVDINEIPEAKIASDRSLIDEICGLNTSDLNPEEIDLLRPGVYEELNKGSDEALFIKVHDAWTLNSRGMPLFPEKVTRAVIYMIRNPLDVAVSFARHNNITELLALERMNMTELSLSGNPEKLSNQCRQKLLSWSEHVKSWTSLSGLPVHVLRYEDMLQDPEHSFRGALDFLGINYLKEDLRRAISFSSFDNLKAQERDKGFHERPIETDSFFDSGKSGNWKQYITQEEARRFFDENTEIMKRFVYEPRSI